MTALLTLRIPNLVLITVQRIGPRAAAGLWSSARVDEARERERARIQKALQTRLCAHLRRDVGCGED